MANRTERLLAEERRRRILEAIEAEGVASARDLAVQFGVSPITIARDLDRLEQDGLIRRVHGGAVSVRGASFEPPFRARETLLAEEKRRIAATAAGLIREGESLILDVGTTTLEVARVLKRRRNLTVIVSNLRAAFELASQPAIQVIVVGGRLRASELSMVGHIAEETLRAFHVDLAIIGVGGITPEQGLTEFNVDEAGVKRVMIAQARRKVVVADHTKLGKVMLAAVAPLAAVDTLVTGREADPAAVARLREAGLEVLLA